jgi:isopentenyl-diphosphate delta-isomerase
VENEICPVYQASTDREPIVNPDEVSEYAWVRPSDLFRAVTDAPWAFSPWMALQIEQLESFHA